MGWDSNVTSRLIDQKFAGCSDRAALREVEGRLKKTDELLIAAAAQQATYSELKKKHIRRIRDELCRPFHEEAKRWQHGDKVFFGARFQSSWFSLDTLRISDRCKIERGEWCRVYVYQPRKKLAWLCWPGDSCCRANVIEQPFTLSDLQRYGISRTELDLRADDWRKPPKENDHV